MCYDLLPTLRYWPNSLSCFSIFVDTCQVTNRPDENGRKSRVCWFCFGQSNLLPSSMVGPSSQPWSQEVIEIMKDSSTSDLHSSSDDNTGFRTKTSPLNKKPSECIGTLLTGCIAQASPYSFIPQPPYSCPSPYFGMPSRSLPFISPYKLPMSPFYGLPLPSYTPSPSA